MRHPVSLFRDLLFVAGLLLFLPISLAHAASAENRVALVIGQSAYRAVPALPNAENDGKRMAELLTNAGFEVTAAPDLSQNVMRQTISDFAAKVAASGPDTIALVFYAGHGLQIDGENYLVPIDVDPKREADIPLQAVRLNDLLNTLGALPTRMRIIMLDACRNNPFPALNQTAGHGLAGAVGFYGMPGERGGAPGPTQRAAELEAPILALQAGDDQNITAEHNEAFEAALVAAGVEHEVVTYPGAPHSFFDRKQEEFAEASEDAWRRVLDFLARHG